MDELKTRLSELRKSISEMTDDELYGAIGASRNNRRNPPPKPSSRKKSSSKAKKKKAEPSVEDFMKNLTPEEKAILLKQLEQ